MAAPSKSLNDIWKDGSAKLTQHGADTTKRMEKTAQDHNQSREGANGSEARVEQKAADLEADVRTFMTSSIERLQKVMDAEIKETEEHLNSVKFDLTTLSEKLKQSIIQLRQSHEDNIENLIAGLSDNYEGAVENSTMDLKTQDFNCSKHLQGHGTAVINGLQQKLDHSLWESRGEEKQYNSALFKAFMQKANSIDTHFSSLMQTLQNDFQTHFQVVEAQSQQSEPKLLNSAQGFAAEIDGFAAQIERDIMDLFTKTLDGHSKQLDGNLSNVAQDLSSVHDSTTESLSQQTKQFGEQLLAASGEARDALSRKCTTLRQDLDTALAAFSARLDDKLKTSQELKSTLEGEKKTIFEDLRGELSEVREAFEKRLTRLMSEAIERVSSVTTEAETEITEAHKRAEGHIKDEGAAARKEIEQSVNSFIEMLTSQRQKALEEIAKAAGDNDGADGAKSGKRKKKDDSSNDLDF